MTKLSLYTIIIYLIIIIILRIIINATTIHPIFILIITTIYRALICLNLSNWNTNFIYSFILFLIIIRGLLIIFLYFSRLISNEQLTIKWNIYIPILLTTIIPILINSFKNNTYINYIIYKSRENQCIIHINQKLFSNIINLYNYPYNYITIISILYLLIRLITIIKLTNINLKPIRKIY